MSRTRILLGIIFFILFFYETGVARNINSTRKVKLKGIAETYTISIKFDSATVTIGLTETKAIIKKLKNKRDFDDRSHQEIFDKMPAYLSEERNYDFDYKPQLIENTLKSEIGWLIVQYALDPILRNGKAKVFNLGTKKFEESVLCHYYRIQMAGEQHQGYEYKFTTGKVFLLNRISI